MSTQHTIRVEALFQRALDLPPEERASFLAANCADDPQMLGEVEALLEHFSAAPADFLSSGLFESDDGPAACDEVQRIGGYRILRKIAEGGMGVVYEALQDNPARVVALKVLRSGLASRELLRRFQREAEVLGRLQHSGIAQIYEAGAVEIRGAGGFSVRQPFFAMEFIHGLPLNQFARERRLSTRTCVELMIRICDAVQHAHQHGVIHRDLKPANILVAADGSAPGALPLPKILDFGIARVTNLDIRGAATQTDAGQLLGTIPYMSPEQFAGEKEVDTRCDIYALGVNLFELLTERLPHDVVGKSLVEAAQIIREQPPTRWREVREVRGPDLEAITAKALAKNKEDRYSSAAELAADLRRYLAGEPIVARHQTALSLLRAQVARYRGLIASGAVAGSLLIALTLYAFYAAGENHRLALSEQSAHLRADRNAAMFAQQLNISNIERGRLLGRAGNLRGAEDLLWPEFLRHPDSPSAHWALWELYSHEPCRAAIQAHSTHLHYLTYSPDGRHLVSCSVDRTVKLWDVDDGGIPFHSRQVTAQAAELAEAAFSRDSRRLAVVEDGDLVQVVDVATGEPRQSLKISDGPVRSICFDPSGTVLVASGEKRLASFWDIHSGRRIAALTQTASQRTRPRLSTDGHTFASFDGAEIQLWSLPELHAGDFTNANHPVADRLRAELGGHTAPVTLASFSDDGRRLASYALDRTLKVWDVETHACLATLPAPNGNSRGLGFGAGDQVLFAAGWWSMVIWDAATLARRQSLSLPETPNFVALRPDARFATAGFPDGSLRVWELANASVLHLPSQTGRVAAEFSPDGRLVATGDESGRLRLWSATTGEMVAELPVQDSPIRTIRFCPTRPWLATGGGDTVKIWSLESRACIAEIHGQFNPSIRCLSFSPRGDLLASTTNLGFELHDPATGALRGTLSPHDSESVSVTFDPAGAALATVSRTNTIRLWNSDSQTVETIDFKGQQPWTIAFEADGDLLACGDWDRTIHIWSRRRHATIATLSGHNGLVRDVAFRPHDSSVLASAGADGTVRLWHIPTQQCLLTLDAFDGWDAECIAFNAAGSRLLAGSANGDTAIWDLTYFDRFIEGNLEYQLRRRAQDLKDAIDMARLNAWRAASDAAALPKPDETKR